MKKWAFLLLILTILIICKSCQEEKEDPLIVMMYEQEASYDNGYIIYATVNYAPSKLYLVNTDTAWNTKADLLKLDSTDYAISVSIDSANYMVEIILEGLVPGIYFGYAIDDRGRISDRSESSVVLIDDCGTCQLVTYVDGVEVSRTLPIPYCGDLYFAKLNDPGISVGDNFVIWECD